MNQNNESSQETSKKQVLVTVLEDTSLQQGLSNGKGSENSSILGGHGKAASSKTSLESLTFGKGSGSKLISDEKNEDEQSGVFFPKKQCLGMKKDGISDTQERNEGGNLNGGSSTVGLHYQHCQKPAGVEKHHGAVLALVEPSPAVRDNTALPVIRIESADIPLYVAPIESDIRPESSVPSHIRSKSVGCPLGLQERSVLGCLNKTQVPVGMSSLIIPGGELIPAEDQEEKKRPASAPKRLLCIKNNPEEVGTCDTIEDIRGFINKGIKRSRSLHLRQREPKTKLKSSDFTSMAKTGSMENLKQVEMEQNVIGERMEKSVPMLKKSNKASIKSESKLRVPLLRRSMSETSVERDILERLVLPRSSNSLFTQGSNNGLGLPSMKSQFGLPELLKPSGQRKISAAELNPTVPKSENRPSLPRKRLLSKENTTGEVWKPKRSVEIEGSIRRASDASLNRRNSDQSTKLETSPDLRKSVLSLEQAEMGQHVNCSKSLTKSAIDSKIEKSFSMSGKSDVKSKLSVPRSVSNESELKTPEQPVTVGGCRKIQELQPSTSCRGAERDFPISPKSENRKRLLSNETTSDASRDLKTNGKVERSVGIRRSSPKSPKKSGHTSMIKEVSTGNLTQKKMGQNVSCSESAKKTAEIKAGPSKESRVLTSRSKKNDQIVPQSSNHGDTFDTAMGNIQLSSEYMTEDSTLTLSPSATVAKTVQPSLSEPEKHLQTDHRYDQLIDIGPVDHKLGEKQDSGCNSVHDAVVPSTSELPLQSINELQQDTGFWENLESSHSGDKLDTMLDEDSLIKPTLMPPGRHKVDVLSAFLTSPDEVINGVNGDIINSALEEINDVGPKVMIVQASVLATCNPPESSTQSLSKQLLQNPTYSQIQDVSAYLIDDALGMSGDGNVDADNKDMLLGVSASLIDSDPISPSLDVFTTAPKQQLPVLKDKFSGLDGVETIPMETYNTSLHGGQEASQINDTHRDLIELSNDEVTQRTGGLDQVSNNDGVQYEDEECPSSTDQTSQDDMKNMTDAEHLLLSFEHMCTEAHDVNPYIRSSQAPTPLLKSNGIKEIKVRRSRHCKIQKCHICKSKAQIGYLLQQGFKCCECKSRKDIQLAYDNRKSFTDKTDAAHYRQSRVCGYCGQQFIVVYDEDDDEDRECCEICFYFFCSEECFFKHYDFSTDESRCCNQKTFEEE